MQLLTKSIMILSLALLVSCANDPYQPVPLVPAPLPKSTTREAQLMASVETMYNINQDLHAEIAQMALAFALLRTEFGVVSREAAAQKEADHAKYIEIYSLLKMREKALDECIGSGVEVLIKPRSVKEKKFDSFQIK